MSIDPPCLWLRTTRTAQWKIAAYCSAIRGAAAVALHLGCGSNIVEGMINCDLFDSAADRRIDCGDLQDFADSSVDLIEHHHLLEHLSFAESQRALTEWARVLRVGGHLVITCPDLERIFRRWVLFPSLRGHLLPMVYGSQEHRGMFHRSGYTRTSLTALLEEKGFTVRLSYSPYPLRPTPSLLVIAQKRQSEPQT